MEKHVMWFHLDEGVPEHRSGSTSTREPPGSQPRARDSPLPLGPGRDRRLELGRPSPGTEGWGWDVPLLGQKASTAQHIHVPLFINRCIHLPCFSRLDATPAPGKVRETPHTSTHTHRDTHTHTHHRVVLLKEIKDAIGQGGRQRVSWAGWQLS